MYEIALKLQREGFLQISNPSPDQGFWFSENDGKAVFMPSLACLIRMCGTGKSGLQNFKLERIYVGSIDKDFVWFACLERDVTGEYGCPSIGDTPEEAVSELWFFLNKKDETVEEK